MTTPRRHDGGAIDIFERQRPQLLGLAYRMLGIVADAEDVVQEAWLRWQATDATTLNRPAAWLTTVTTRLALDRLRTSRRRREEYPGPWLPEPVVVAPGPEEVAEMSESLTLGFLTLLDRLRPVERAVFLLVEVFEVPFTEVAATVNKSEVACRQIASRARHRLREGGGRPAIRTERRVVDELVMAVAQGDVTAALARIAPDAVLVSDGGPKRRAARRPVVGADRIVRLLTNLARRSYGEAQVVPSSINGDPGFVVSVDGAVDFAAAFEVEDERVAAIWLVRNPDKLEHLVEPLALT
ncbi:MAG TPA: RNA polymerase sigma factor SigJ [Acidimicrobiales bacterium]